MRHLIFTILILFSCINNNTSKKIQKVRNLDNNLNESNHQELITSEEISFPCAIFLSPPKKFIDSLKQEDGKGFHNSILEIITYFSEAKKYFELHKIKSVEKISVGKLKFHLIDQSDTTLNLKGFYWGILLFNGKEAPIHMGRSDFDMEVGEYMNVKNK